MTGVDLETVRENLEFMLEAFRQELAPIPPTLAYAESCLIACRRARQHAIALLLCRAETKEFLSRLSTAAQIRLDFLLATAGSTGLFVDFRASADLAGFADALAAGRVDLAKRIAQLSTGEWNSDVEYEEDHWFAKALHELLIGDFVTGSRYEVALAGLVAASDGEETVSVRLVKALGIRDEEMFSVALAERVDEHREWFARKGDGIVADPDEFATERHVFVVGLALKLLATRMGIAVRSEEPLMPREAWVLA